jgi:RHS repeat-associated protein
VTRSNQGTQTVAVQTRNVAGLVMKRKTTITGSPTSPMTFVESNWTYDKLGRVASQVVQKGPGPTLVAEQALTYFGNDDPKTLDQYLGSSHKQFSYDYDYRHQLTSADETTTSGSFSGTYSYGAAGRFTQATEVNPSPAPGSEVKPRDVTYHYAGLDPEQVTSLTNAGSGTTYASYTYDASGNQTERCYGAMPCAGESTEYVYDGADRLRRATKKQNGVVVASEEYWYDGRGSRMATVKRDASGAKTELIWWLADTEAHYDGAGTKQHVYSYISMGTPVARTDRDGSGTAKLEFTFHGLGNSTLAAVDRDTGTVNASFSYAPFGEIVEATDDGGGAGAGVAAHRRRMNDKFIDEVSDLAYYGARYYDKTSMTWTQPDPLFRFRPDARWTAPRNGNLYTFTLNNANRYMDPDGRITWEDVGGVFVDVGEVAAGVAAGVGAVVSSPAVLAVGVVTIVAVGTAVTMTGGGTDEITTDGQGCGSHCDLPPPGSSTDTTQPTPKASPEPTSEGPSAPKEPIGKNVPPPTIPGPPPKDAAGPRGGRGKGERNWERNNPNTDKYRPKRDPGSPTGWSRKDPHTGRKIPVKPPEQANPGNGQGNGGQNQNAGTHESDKKHVEPEGCGIECVPAF